MNKLPDKLSSLLKLALCDLSLCERSKKYRINMSSLHSYYEPRCHVCLAGAVLAKTFKMPLKEKLFFGWIGGINLSDEKKLLAIDYCRQGYIQEALSFFAIAAKTDQRAIADYHEDTKQFKKDMRKLIKDLEAVNA